MKKLLHIILISITPLLVFNCTSPKNVNPEQGSQVVKGQLKLHLHNYIAEDEVDAYGITYTTPDGQAIKLNCGQLYLSGFQLIKADSSVYSVPDTVILKTQDLETYTLPSVPVGNYIGLSFYVGLNDSQDQSTVSVLGESSMFFENSTKHVFLNVSGSMDTSANYDGSMADFNYKIGTSTNLKKVQMPFQKFTISEDFTQYAHMKIDYLRMFLGINLSQKENLSATKLEEQNKEVVTKILNNLPQMFIYE